jgi:MFS family permease
MGIRARSQSRLRPLTLDAIPNIERPGRTARPLVLSALGLAGIIAALVQTLVLPLLPQFPRLLGVSVADASWIATSTMIIGAIAAPLFGWLGDRFGLKPMIILSLVLLMTGSVLSALADDLPLMLAGRVLQGCGMGIVGLSLALLRRLVHVQLVPMAVGLLTGTVGIGTGLGVPLAGILVEYYPWQAIFWLTAAAAAVAATLVAMTVPPLPPSSSRAFDIVGAVGLTTLIVLVLLPVTAMAQSDSDATLYIVGMLGSAAFVAGAWVWHQLRARSPFIDLRIVAIPAVWASHIIALLLGFAFFLSFTATITVTQMPAGGAAGLGGSVLLTGLVQLPPSLLSIVAPPLAGLLVMREGARTALILGLTLTVAAFGLRIINLTDPIAISVTAMLVSGSISFAFAALPVALMNAAPLDQLGATGGVNMLCRQLGAAAASVIGAAIIAAIINFSLPNDATAFHWLFGLGAAASTIALLVTALSPSLRSQPTSNELIP